MKKVIFKNNIFLSIFSLFIFQVLAFNSSILSQPTNYVKKQGGICFRTDDDQPMQNYIAYSDIFNRYNKTFSFAINLGTDLITPEYVDMIKVLQSHGHEMMDHTPWHNTFWFSTKLGTEYFQNHPGVHRIFGNNDIELKYDIPNIADAKRSGIVNINGNIVTSNDHIFANVPESNCYLYFPLLDTLVFIDAKTGWISDDMVEIKDYWQSPVNINLGQHQNVLFYNFHMYDVHIPKDAIKALAEESLRIANFYGLERPYAWIQPGGYQVQCHRNEIMQALGSDLGYKCAGIFPDPGLKVFNEYNTYNDNQFGMNFGDFRDDIWTLEHCKEYIADKIAKHHVAIGENHFTWGYEGLLGGWEGFLARTEGLLQWSIEKNIPIKNYTEWADILYNQIPDPYENIFPPLNVDLDENNIPDGYNSLINSVLDKNDGAPVLNNYSLSINKQGTICKIENLGGIEKGENDFEIWTKGSPGNFIEVDFKIGSNHTIFKFPAENSFWTKYCIGQSINGTTILSIPEDISLVNITINCSNYLSGNVKISGMRLQVNYLTVNANELNFPSIGGIEEVIVSSNIDWNVIENYDWVSVSQVNGSNIQNIFIEVDENHDAQERTGIVTIQGGGLNCSVTIEQQAYQPPQPIDFSLNVNLFLEGAYESNRNMNSVLSALPEFPLVQPFGAEPWNYYGTETISNISEDIVDWILVSLRSSTEKEDEIFKKAFLLKADGTIIDTEGNAPVVFVLEGEYYLVIEQRNHLPIMSTNKLDFHKTISLE
ncbi:MAG: BACON domain-containing protein [Melioribacteraceae bacterium]